jgi:hypothetical protein
MAFIVEWLHILDHRFHHHKAPNHHPHAATKTLQEQFIAEANLHDNLDTDIGVRFSEYSPVTMKMRDLLKQELTKDCAIKVINNKRYLEAHKWLTVRHFTSSITFRMCVKDLYYVCYITVPDKLDVKYFAKVLGGTIKDEHHREVIYNSHELNVFQCKRYILNKIENALGVAVVGFDSLRN